MIQLGDKAKDSVSGFTGIAIGRTEWLHGCIRIILQPAIGKDGKLPDSAKFDEPQLLLIKKCVVLRGNPKTGGPAQMPMMKIVQR